MTDHLASHDRTRDMACRWAVRLQSETATEADWIAFENWLETPENAAAYRAVEDVWLALDPEPGGGVTAIEPRPRLRRGLAWTIGLGLAASIAAVMFAGPYLRQALDLPHAPTTYRAPADAPLTVSLGDGSRLVLNRGAAVTVRLAHGARSVEMSNGEVVFDVAKDPGRPFTIRAGDRQIQVVGTEFDVIRQSGQFAVTVRRGVVEVSGATRGDATRLTAGQSLHSAEAGDEVSSADASSAFSWTQGRLIYVDAPLSEIAADLSRYGDQPVAVDPQIARSVRVTATLQLDTQAAMLRRLEAFAPIRVIHQPGGVQLSSRGRGL